MLLIQCVLCHCHRIDVFIIYIHLVQITFDVTFSNVTPLILFIEVVF